MIQCTTLSTHTIIYTLLIILLFFSEVLAVYYHETDYKKYKTLKKITKCFGIFIPEDLKPQGLYLKLFRFVHIQDNPPMLHTVLVIEWTSPVRSVSFHSSSFILYRQACPWSNLSSSSPTSSHTIPSNTTVKFPLVLLHVI